MGFDYTQALNDRRALIIGPVDLANMRGIELGALSNPAVRREDGDILYVDYADTEELRKNIYPDSVHVDDLVDVDIVWGERPLIECAGEPVDYAIAVHVIEHVADVVGWLNQIHDVLKPGGYFCLVIPDRRFTFDILRPESTVGELVQAHLEGRWRPTPAQKFDFTSLWRHVDAHAAWEGYPDLDALAPTGPDNVEVAYAQARELHEGEDYMDAHCWVFTPESFLRCIAMLNRLGLFPFEIENFVDTQPGELEFFLHLRRSDDPARREDTIRAALNSVVPTAPASDPNEDHTAAMQGLEAEIGALRMTIEEIKASSSWKLTAPLRLLKRMISGGSR